MRDLTQAELLEVQRITDEHARTLKTRSTTANETENTDFAAFNKRMRETVAFEQIKTIAATHNVRESTKIYALKRNLEAQKKKEKSKQNNSVSQPFWY